MLKRFDKQDGAQYFVLTNDGGEWTVEFFEMEADANHAAKEDEKHLHSTSIYVCKVLRHTNEMITE
jgi:hypothetical protein